MRPLIFFAKKLQQAFFIFGVEQVVPEVLILQKPGDARQGFEVRAGRIFRREE